MTAETTDAAARISGAWTEVIFEVDIGPMLLAFSGEVTIDRAGTSKAGVYLQKMRRGPRPRF